MTRCLSLALLLAIFPGAIAQAKHISESETQIPREQTLVIGRISDDQKKHFSRMMNFGTYLAEDLHNHGIAAADVLIATTPDAMIENLRERQVDVVFESPFVAVRFIEEANAEPLARQWKKGVPTYHSVLIKRRDTDITELSDLRGRKIAFEDKGSTSAYLLPAAILAQHGQELILLESIFDDVPADKVGYLFAGSEKAVVSTVARGLADVGALSNLDWDGLLRTPAILKDKLEIFYESEPVLRSVVLVRAGLGADLKRRIRQRLFAMGDDAAGLEVMKEFNRTTRYDALDQQALDSLSRIRALIPLLPRLPQ